MKKIQAVFVFAILGGLIGFQSLAYSGEPSKVLDKFIKAFNSKNFETSSKYLSKLDTDYLKELNKRMEAFAKNANMPFKELSLAQILQGSWQANNDPEMKKKMLDRLSNYLNAHPGKTPGENETLRKKFNLLKKISLKAKFVPFSGKVIKEKIKGDYAVVIADSYVEYPEEVIKDAKEFHKSLGKKETPQQQKHTKWIGNKYHFPTIFYLTKENKNWKVVYFNKKAFPSNKFSETIEKYKPY